MTKQIQQIKETEIVNMFRVIVQDERGSKIVTFAKAGDRNDPPVKFEGQISK